VTKSRKIRWAGKAARMGQRRGVYRWGNLSERNHLEDPGIDGWIILGWILCKWEGGHGLV